MQGLVRASLPWLGLYAVGGPHLTDPLFQPFPWTSEQLPQRVAGLHDTPSPDTLPIGQDRGQGVQVLRKRSWFTPPDLPRLALAALGYTLV